MAISKVQLSDGRTLVDLTSDTVTAASMLVGFTAHGSDGQQVTGTIRAMTEAEIIAAVDAAFTGAD